MRCGMVIECFNCEEIDVPYKFIRNNLLVVLENEEDYQKFFSEFKILLFKEVTIQNIL
jgi:hypothetical protein